MPAGATVLIGSSQLASAVAARPDAAGRELLIFAEHDVREAVETIVRRRPEIVVVSATFAQTPRGTALTYRVAIDRQLAHTQIWIVGPDGHVAPVKPQVAPTWLGLDTSGTRRVPRVRIRPGVSVHIDGAPAHLVDLSTMGAQVVSATVLKPNQRVRVLAPVEADTTRAVGNVAWAVFELPKGSVEPRYRAGLAFSISDAELLLRLCLIQADDPSATLHD
jgi:hypothetical protein